jgi:nitroreductase
MPQYVGANEPSMNATIELLMSRRSAKPANLSGPGPSAPEVDALLRIAARVPDHGKLAPCRFIVFEGEGRARAGEIIAEVYGRRHPDADARRLETERMRLSVAPRVVTVVSRAAS